MTAQTLWRVGFVGAVLIQCYALYAPSTPSTDTDLPLDKVVHFGLFAAVGLLGVLSGVPVRWLIVGLIGQAVLSEFVQAQLLDERGGDLADLLADLLGAGVGVAVGLALVGRRTGPG